MKTIKNTLIALFLFGLVATGLSQKPENKSRILLLHPTESIVSSAAIAQSVDVITRRLESFSSEKFRVTPIPGKNQIQVVMDDKCDLKLAEMLLTQKGTITFHEAYYYKSLEMILQRDTTLFSLLHANRPGDSTAEILCTNKAGINAAVHYLDSVESNHTCRFAWSNLFDDSQPGLYALKTENGDGIILKGSDIESFQFGHDSVWHQDYIQFKCRKSAVPLWADITKRNINQAIAILLDGKVISAPVVRGEITGGKSIITGNFSADRLKFIEAVGNSGELPVNLEVVK